MKIKTMMLTLGLAMTLPLTALAGDDKAEHVSKALNLDDSRAKQVEQIFNRYDDQHDMLKKQKKEQLKTLLTDDEYEQLEDMWEAKKDAKKDWKKN